MHYIRSRSWVYSPVMKRTRKRGGRSAVRRKLPGLNQFKEARRFLANLRDEQVPRVWEWESLLVDEVLERFPTKSAQAEALGLSREGYRKKLLRMGLDW